MEATLEIPGKSLGRNPKSTKKKKKSRNTWFLLNGIKHVHLRPQQPEAAKPPAQTRQHGRCTKENARVVRTGEEKVKSHAFSDGRRGAAEILQNR